MVTDCSRHVVDTEDSKDIADPELTGLDHRQVKCWRREKLE